MNRHVVVQSLSTLSPFPSLNSRTSKCSINNSAHKRVFTGGGVIQELLATTTHEHDTYTHAQTKCGNSMEVSNQSQPKLQSSLLGLYFYSSYCRFENETKIIAKRDFRHLASFRLFFLLLPLLIESETSWPHALGSHRREEGGGRAKKLLNVATIWSVKEQHP